MKYTKPQLRPFPAMAVIQEIGHPVKGFDFHEGPPHQARGSDPAYQADE
jgi:hypothetical protein